MPDAKDDGTGTGDADDRDDQAERPRVKLMPREPAPLEERPGEPPVVARLIVEIRSDGSRTIARGGLEDLQGGQRVAIEAHGDSPMSLALELARAIMQTRQLAGQIAGQAAKGAAQQLRSQVLRRLLPWRRGK